MTKLLILALALLTGFLLGNMTNDAPAFNSCPKPYQVQPSDISGGRIAPIGEINIK